MKKIISGWVPPILLKQVRSLRSPWQGSYNSWAEAKAQTIGYNSEEILQRVSDATREVQSSRKAYERDSILFDEVLYSWPLVSALQYTYLRDGYLNVLDFGGSLGSSYYQNKFFLERIPKRSWNVVEQESFVEEGKRSFETSDLFFFKTIREAQGQKKINFILLSSVLQYLENPYQILKEIVGLEATTVFLDRLAVIDSEKDVISIQTVPPEIYPASYPCWFFNEEKIKGIMIGKYKLFSEFNSFTPNEGYLKGMKFGDKGHFYILK